MQFGLTLLPFPSKPLPSMNGSHTAASQFPSCLRCATLPIAATGIVPSAIIRGAPTTTPATCSLIVVRSEAKETLTFHIQDNHLIYSRAKGRCGAKSYV